MIVDPKARRITIENSNRFHTKKRLIPFSDIGGISIGYSGKEVELRYAVLPGAQTQKRRKDHCSLRALRGRIGQIHCGELEERLEEHLGQ